MYAKVVEWSNTRVCKTRGASLHRFEPCPWHYMKKLNRVASLFFIVGLSVFLSGCVKQPTIINDNVAVESPTKTIRGTVSVNGNTILIKNGGVLTEITSRKLNLSQFEGQEVEVKGEFSGTTLFVDEVN